MHSLRLHLLIAMATVPLAARMAARRRPRLSHSRGITSRFGESTSMTIICCSRANALLVINRLLDQQQCHSPRRVQPQVDLQSVFYWDTSDDGLVSPHGGALLVINGLLAPVYGTRRHRGPPALACWPSCGAWLAQEETAKIVLAGVMARVPACPADTPSAFFGADPCVLRTPPTGGHRPLQVAVDKKSRAFLDKGLHM